jgi:hypothetical protein
VKGWSCRSCRQFAVAEAGAEDFVDEVASAAGEAEDRSVVLLAFAAFAGVVVAGGVVVQRAGRGEPERVLEAIVPTTRAVLAV